jgi:hypothetical protein
MDSIGPPELYAVAMKKLEVRRRALPAALTVLTLAGCAPPICEVVPVPKAAEVTYQCSDGRTCSAPRPDEKDGGVYQVCPGHDGCSTLVAFDGTSTIGFC